LHAENEVKAAEARVAAAWEELLASDLSGYSGELRSLVGTEKSITQTGLDTRRRADHQAGGRVTRGAGVCLQFTA
jgi:hypothetical protein